MIECAYCGTGETAGPPGTFVCHACECEVCWCEGTDADQLCAECWGVAVRLSFDSTHLLYEYLREIRADKPPEFVTALFYTETGSSCMSGTVQAHVLADMLIDADLDWLHGVPITVQLSCRSS